MSNFSNAYKMYLLGYVGEVGGRVQEMISERQAQALALGVYHRTASKPPLMSSVVVMAELRAMTSKMRTEPVTFTRLLFTNVAFNQKIPAIKAVREISNLGLKEAKDVCDDVCGGDARDLVHIVNPFWRPELTPSDRIVAAAKLLREAGCTVEVS